MKQPSRFTTQAALAIACVLLAGCAGAVNTGSGSGGVVPYNSLPWKLGLITKTN